MMSTIQQEPVTGLTTILAEINESLTITEFETYHVKLVKDGDGRFVPFRP